MKPRLVLALVVGVAAVSVAAILVRLCEAPALAIAAWRLAFASAPVLAARALVPAAPLLPQDRRVMAGAGVALALHFATWISSLSFTTVASSVAIVTTQPVWVALLSALWLKERPRPLTLVAMGVALAGSLVIAGADLALSGRALWGDLLALLGAVFAAAYLVAGRKVRGRVPLLPYLSVVYPVAAVALVGLALGSGAPLVGFSGKTWLLLLALAWVPQLVGHTLLNWALQHASAALVSIAILGEPVFATLLAIPLLGETPGPTRVAGGLLVLVGVALAVRSESRPSDASKVPVAS